ncbi:MAG: hypothetical protein P8048_10935, partial [Calditrichia bacterium]
WTLWRAGINTRRFIERIRTALKEGGTDAALEICESTRGPVASMSTFSRFRWRARLPETPGLAT